MRTPVYRIDRMRSHFTIARLGSTILVETFTFPALGIHETTTHTCDASETTTDAIARIYVGTPTRIA